MSVPSLSSSSRLDESVGQRPFSASSEKGFAGRSRNEGIRMRDKEMNIERAQQQQQYAQGLSSNGWNELDNLLGSLGLKSDQRSRLDETPLHRWSSQDPSASSSSSNVYDSATARRTYAASRDQMIIRSSEARSRGRSQRQFEAPPTLAQHLRDVVVAQHDGSGLTPEMFIQSTTPRGSRPNRRPMGGREMGRAAPPSFPMPEPSADDTLSLLLPLLVLLSTLLFLLSLFILLVIIVRRRARIALTEGDGPLDVGREEELEGLGGLDGVEERWLETVDDATRRGYMRAKDWNLSFPAGSQSSEITLSQFLSIQEKGVSAWSFDPDYENNPSVFVGARTEIAFMADGEGMAPQEGGGCSVQSNLPLPKLNEVYYWEAKMFTKPESTNVAVGLATKPYPGFRMPGWSKYSVGFFSADGFKCHNYPFAAQSYGPTYQQGDVIGVGYRPRSGTVFFTRNGKKLEDAFVGLNRYNLFPTIGANGAAEVHVNLGQAGFVFIEANVKKWGLAPMVGTLAPPPPYGMERGSILIETGQGTSSNDAQRQAEGEVAPNSRNNAYLRPPHRNRTPPPPLTPPNEEVEPRALSARLSRRARARLARRAAQRPNNPSTAEEENSASSEVSDSDSNASSVHDGLTSFTPRRDSLSSMDEPHNPPTPHHLDISLHSLDGSAAASGTTGSGTTSMRSDTSPSTSRAHGPSINVASYFPNMMNGSSHRASASRTRSPSPPPYSEARHGWPSSSDYNAMNQARRSSGRTHSLANALFGALADRGLLTPLSAHDRSDEVNSSNANHTNDFDYQTSTDTPLPSNTRDHSSASQRPSTGNGWLASWFS